MRQCFPAILVAVLLGGCAAVRTTQEVNSALVGKSREEVEEYFGRRPDKVYGQTSYVYSGKFYEPNEKIAYNAAVVVFSHFDPDTVWSVGFTRHGHAWVPSILARPSE